MEAIADAEFLKILDEKCFPLPNDTEDSSVSDDNSDDGRVVDDSGTRRRRMLTERCVMNVYMLHYYCQN
jgi:hypothetical protein